MNWNKKDYETVAVFGCTADPFTVAHRDICMRSMDELSIDKLYVIPTVVDYHREGKKRWLSDTDRVYCIKHMLMSLGPKYLGKWEIYEREINLKAVCRYRDELRSGRPMVLLSDLIIKPRRFLHTLLDLKAEVGVATRVLLILGSDSVRDFRKWYQWREVGKLASGIVMIEDREGEKFNPQGIAKAINRRITPMELSCSEYKYVSASNVRSQYADWGNLDDYIGDMILFDSGRKSLEELGWIRTKKGMK